MLLTLRRLPPPDFVRASMACTEWRCICEDESNETNYWDKQECERLSSATGRRAYVLSVQPPVARAPPMLPVMTISDFKSGYQIEYGVRVHDGIIRRSPIEYLTLGLYDEVVMHTHDLNTDVDAGGDLLTWDGDYFTLNIPVAVHLFVKRVSDGRLARLLSISARTDIDTEVTFEEQRDDGSYDWTIQFSQDFPIQWSQPVPQTEHEWRRRPQTSAAYANMDLDVSTERSTDGDGGAIGDGDDAANRRASLLELRVHLFWHNGAPLTFADLWKALHDPTVRWT